MEPARGALHAGSRRTSESPRATSRPSDAATPFAATTTKRHTANDWLSRSPITATRRPATRRSASGSDEAQRPRAVVSGKNRLGRRLDADHADDSLERVIRRDHGQGASRYAVASARGQRREADACSREPVSPSGVRHRTRRMATRRYCSMRTAEFQRRRSKCNCSVVALSHALSRKNTADVPGTPVIVCARRARERNWRDRVHGLPDGVKNPQ